MLKDDTEYMVNDFIKRNNLLNTSDEDYWHDELMLLLAKHKQLINQNNANLLLRINSHISEINSIISSDNVFNLMFSK